MKSASVALRLAAWLAIVGIGWSQLLPVAVAAEPSPAVTDVALREGGVLIGQVVDPQGIARAGVPVAIRSGPQTLAMGTTDTGGYFAFSGLPGGVYQIATREGLGTYRAWTPGAAPTSAQPGALLIDGNEVVRGAGQTLRFYLSNPWVLGVIAAGSMGTATALILDNQHPHSP